MPVYRGNLLVNSLLLYPIWADPDQLNVRAVPTFRGLVTVLKKKIQDTNKQDKLTHIILLMPSDSYRGSMLKEDSKYIITQQKRGST